MERGGAGGENGGLVGAGWVEREEKEGEELTRTGMGSRLGGGPTYVASGRTVYRANELQPTR